MSELRLPKLNLVVLSGRLTRDCELKYTPSGVAVSKISLAFDRSFKKNDEWVQETSYIDVVVWSKLAERAAERLHKGSPVTVEGYIQTRTYQNKENQNVKITEIVAHKVDMLEKVNSTTSSQPANNVDDDSDDVPF